MEPLAPRGAAGGGARLRSEIGIAGDRRTLAARFKAIHLFRDVRATAAGRAFAALLRTDPQVDPAAAAAAYARLFAALAAEGWTGDAWRAHVADAVGHDGNAFTLSGRPGPGLRAAAARDLASLSQIARGSELDAWRESLATLGLAMTPCHDLGQRAPDGVAARLAAAEDWAALADELRTHAGAGGAGPFARAWAFRWRPATRRVEPVRRPDLPRAADLRGYDVPRGAVVRNTERFLAGLPAADVLLYGDRGTGKSTTVKALLTAYGDRGLRLVELGRRHLAELPDLLDALHGAPQRFIVFVDDLSFEEGETEYKDVKAALQGGIHARPDNVLVYATSNRRHLVRERLSERDPDDPRAGDSVQEKLSLADRFGLTVIFAAPDQGLYLDIVAHIAARRGVALPPEELRARALRWALWQGGRSGRTATQFVDALRGQAGVAEEGVQ